MEKWPEERIAAYKDYVRNYEKICWIMKTE